MELIAVVVGCIAALVGVFLWGYDVGEHRERRAWFATGATWRPADTETAPPPIPTATTTYIVTPTFTMTPIFFVDEANAPLFAHSAGVSTSTLTRNRKTN